MGNEVRFMGRESFTMTDEQGNEEVFEILYAFESEEFNKKYVIFYPSNIEGDRIELLAAIYDEKNCQLVKIETDEEWEYIRSVVEELNEANEDLDAYLYNKECEKNDNLLEDEKEGYDDLIVDFIFNS